MPIRPENAKRYPADWKLRSRFVRQYRAKNRCEWCGVRQYGVGYWDAAGRFWYAGGSLFYDDFQYTESYRLARDACDSINENRLGDEPRHIVIVLTTAHVHDDRPEASGLLNLAALCQRCHNAHDMKDRAQGRRERREAASGQERMFA